MMSTSHVDVVVSQEVKLILEPSISQSSLEFIKDESEDDQNEPQDAAMEKVTRQVLTYKLIRATQMLAIGDPVATVAQLNVLYDLELQMKFVQNILLKHGGIDVIINLLEVKDPRCIIGALKVIQKVASNNAMRLHITNLGAISNIIELMVRPELEILIEAAKCATQLCRVQRAARFFRKLDGIQYLIGFLDVSESLLNTSMDLLKENHIKKIKLATASAEALKQITSSPKAAQYLYKHGLLLVLRRLTNSCHKKLLVQIFELLVLCGKNAHLRQIIETEGIMFTLVQYLNDDDERVRAACAMTIGECATDSELTCHVVRILHGLPTLVNLSKNLKQEIPTLSAITLAIAKLAQNTKCLKIMSGCGLVFNLIKFMKATIGNNDITANVLEGLAECSRLEENRHSIANSGVIPNIIGTLLGTDSRVLMAASMCLGTLARTPEIAEMIQHFEGMRLLFSVLQVDMACVLATALWALRPIVQNNKESAEEIRSTNGGFTVLTSLLTLKDTDVVAQACGLVAAIAEDTENLQILSDCGLVQALADCTIDATEPVRSNLAEAISKTAILRPNAQEFGWLGVVNVMRNYLESSNVALHTHAMRALAALTQVPFNCVVLHECQGVTPVMNDVAAPYPELQDLASIVLRNMRKTVMRVEDSSLAKCDMGVYARMQQALNLSDASNTNRLKAKTKKFFTAIKRQKNDIFKNAE